MRLLYFIRDPYPCNRRDVLTLFGERLPLHGIRSEIVASFGEDSTCSYRCWPAGGEHLHQPSRLPGLRALGRLGHQLKVLWAQAGQCDALVVRDETLIALVAMLVAPSTRVVYWMSFPMSDSDLARSRSSAETSKRRVLLRWRGRLTGFLLYRLIVPRAAAVFVQSEAMREMVASRSGRSDGLIPVPMGVDEAEIGEPLLTARELLPDEPFRLVYLGSLDRIRRIEFLLEVLQGLILRDPGREYRLVLIGGASTESEYAWLEQAVRERSLEPSVQMTGPLPREAALQRAANCHVGLSAIPRGAVFDVSSPTKMLEYLALGLPVLVNDIPDQEAVLADAKGAGLCRPMEIEQFVDAILEMRARYESFAASALRARDWVRKARGYDVLSAEVAGRLREALTERSLRAV
jgi:glycosyltransferase involved in cell wall biosynthesis